ncbi:MAG: hypothetical protein WBI17_12970 [Clostridiaceae bacterium]
MEEKDKRFDDLLFNRFDTAKKKELKPNLLKVEPHYNERMLVSLAKDKREKKIITFLFTLLVILTNISMISIPLIYFGVPLWGTILITVFVLVSVFSLILTAYGLNEFYLIKE